MLLGEPERLPLAIRGFVVRRVIHNRKTDEPGLIFPLAGPDDWQTEAMAVAEGLILDETAVAELAGLRGDVVSHDAYDEHRKIWNGSIDRPPALIARCAGVADVISAVKFGRTTGLPVAVRSGGHSFPGLSMADDAL